MRENKFLLLVVLAVLFASCNNAGKEKKSTSTTNELSHGTQTEVIHLTTAEFKEKVFNYEANKEWKYEGNIPCIVDFYADWCGPCKKIAPTLDELSKEYKGKIIIYKVNTDKEPELAKAFGIRSIPTILFIPQQGEPQTAQGALPKSSFEKAINEVLLTGTPKS